MNIKQTGNIHIKTHNDLDAVSSIILLQNIYENKIVSIEYNTYNEIEESISNFIKKHEYTSGDTLFITDISFSDELAEKLNKTKDLTIYLLDHHKTAQRLQKYSWATVSLKKHVSATEVVYNTLSTPQLKPFEPLVKATSAWDTWELDSPHRTAGEHLNTLLGFIGKEEFIRAHLQNPTAWLTHPYYKKLIIHLDEKKERFITQVIRRQVNTAKIRLDGMCQHYMVIFATDYISELGNKILEIKKDDISYVCIINPALNTISLRSKNEIDVSKVAKYLGGGGHKNAAGFRINFTEDIENTLDQILNRINY